jgi:hypothetical protein
MRLFKTILMAFCMLGAVAVSRVGAQPPQTTTSLRPNAFNRLTQQEIHLLLGDVAEMNPQVAKLLREDPEMRKGQLENLRQLLAFASEAQKTLLPADPQLVNELENVRVEVVATNYDKHINKGKPPKGSFGYITDATIAAYWGESPGTRLPASVKAKRKSDFEKFLTTKLYFLSKTDPGLKDRGLTDAELAQAREIFARTHIYAAEYARRESLLPLTFRQKAALQVKLQTAQFLARLYTEALASQITATDAEIADYLKRNPDLDTEPKRTKAEKLLSRAKSGEDFAALANQFSEDPGNKNQKNEPQGGLYENVSRGTMVPPFELAALALTPGQIAPHIVETDFGFHIIKLERKGEAPSGTYDVRHILVGTAIGDPSDPAARPVPVMEHVRKEIESEKEKKIIDRLVAANKISVPEDFEVPSTDAKPPVVPKATTKPAARRARKRT